MSITIADSECGEMIRIDCTIAELRQAAADKYNPDIATIDDEWGDFLYEMGWSVYVESDILNKTIEEALGDN